MEPKQVETKDLTKGQKVKLIGHFVPWQVYKVTLHWVVLISDVGKTRWILRNDRRVWVIEDADVHSI